MLGSSLRQAAASTPPSAIGTSTDSPVRLSVMVMLSGTAAALLDRDLDSGSRLLPRGRRPQGQADAVLGGGGHAVVDRGPDGTGWSRQPPPPGRGQADGP